MEVCEYAVESNVCVQLDKRPGGKWIQHALIHRAGELQQCWQEQMMQKNVTINLLLMALLLLLALLLVLLVLLLRQRSGTGVACC